MTEGIAWRDLAVLLGLVCIGAAIVFFGARGTKTKKARDETITRYEELLCLENFESASVDGFYKFVDDNKELLSTTAKKIDALFPEKLKHVLDEDGEKIKLIVMHNIFNDYVCCIVYDYELTPMKDNGIYCTDLKKAMPTDCVYKTFRVEVKQDTCTIDTVFDIRYKCCDACAGHDTVRTLSFTFIDDIKKHKDLNIQAFDLFRKVIADSRYKNTMSDLISEEAE